MTENTTSVTINPTASQTLSWLAHVVRENMQPPPRGHSTAATLRQIADIAGELPLSTTDVILGYMLLGGPIPGEEHPVIGRRATCRELALLGSLVGGGDQIAGATTDSYVRLGRVCRAVMLHFESSEDPRHLALSRTARREMQELADAAGQDIAE